MYHLSSFWALLILPRPWFVFIFQSASPCTSCHAFFPLPPSLFLCSFCRFCLAIDYTAWTLLLSISLLYSPAPSKPLVTTSQRRHGICCEQDLIKWPTSVRWVPFDTTSHGIQRARAMHYSSFLFSLSVHLQLCVLKGMAVLYSLSFVMLLAFVAGGVSCFLWPQSGFPGCLVY